MKTQRRFATVLYALWELLHYDMMRALLGFRGVHAMLGRGLRPGRQADPADEEAVVSAMKQAVCLYFKRVHCLQCAITTARLLRSRGVPANVMFGYRVNSFMGHAWVEVNGRVVTGGAGYRKAMDLITTAEP